MKNLKKFEIYITSATGSSPILDTSDAKWLEELNNLEINFENENDIEKWTDELRELGKKYPEMKSTTEYLEHLKKWHNILELTDEINKNGIRNKYK